MLIDTIRISQEYLGFDQVNTGQYFEMMGIANHSDGLNVAREDSYFSFLDLVIIFTFLTWLLSVHLIYWMTLPVTFVPMLIWSQTFGPCSSNKITGAIVNTLLLPTCYIVGGG